MEKLEVAAEWLWPLYALSREKDVINVAQSYGC